MMKKIVALAFALFFTNVTLSEAQNLPAGALGTVAGNTANQYSNYSYNFTAAQTGSYYILFAFRQDPAFWTFGNVSLTAAGSTNNILYNGNMASGGTTTVPLGNSTTTVTAPTGWGVFYQTGTVPAAAGTWQASGGPNNGGAWYDGAVGSFDGIYQGVSVTNGTQYTIRFSAMGNNTASNPSIMLGTYAGVCATLSLAPAQCTLPSSLGFTTLATPAQGQNATTPGVTPPAPAGPTVVSTGPGTPIVTSTSAIGTPTTTSVTNNSTVSSVDSNGNPVVTTYFTVTATTTTPTTTSTTTTPVTVTTYSDGTTTTANGTPVVTSATTNSVTATTTQPAVQNVATTRDVVTTHTTSGTATSVSSTVNLPTMSSTVVTYTRNLIGQLININQSTTVTTDHPSTTTTVVTTPITTVTTHTPTTTNTNASGAVVSITQANPTNVSNTIYQNNSSSVNNDYYTQTNNSVNQTVSATGFNDAIKFRNTNPFLVDALSQKDGAFADPTASYYKAAGTMSSGGIQAGYQWTVDNNSFGLAASYSNAKSGGLIGSSVQADTYDVTAYILSKQEDVWVKGSIGGGFGNYSGSNSMPAFALYNSAKFKQYNYYADLTLYTADTYYGFRPLVGATVNRSQIKNYSETGISLLSTAPTMNSTSVNPYVGIRYDFDNNIGFETRVTQTKDFKTVGSIRAVAKTEIDKGVFLNATVGFDKGTNYTGAVGTVGVKINF
jgi:hypothetical protein